MVAVTYSKGKIEASDLFEYPVIEDDGIPEDLAPIGDSPFYYQPEAVDPRDCENYPDSIFCGGTPFSPSLFEVDVTPTVDECGRVYLELNATIGFVDMPPQTFAYVPEGCRGNKPPTVPVPPQLGARIPESNYSGLADNKQYIMGISATYTDQKPSVIHQLRCGSVRVGIASIQTADSNLFPEDTPEGYPVINNFPGETSGSGEFFKLHKMRVYQSQFNNSQVTPVIGDIIMTFPLARPWILSGSGLAIKKVLRGDCGVYWETADDFFPGRNAFAVFEIGYKNMGQGASGEVNWRTDEITHVLEIETCKSPTPTDPPSLPLPGEPCCMECCNGSQNDRLLREILDQVKKGNKAIGVEKLPSDMPTELTDDNAGSTPIPDLATGLFHFVKLMANIQGKYPIEVDIEDSDLLEPGEQKLSIKLPNQAEAIAEIFGLVYQIKTTSDAAFSASMRTLAEAGAIRNTAAQEWFLTLAIAEFLGFELVKDRTEMKYAFNPNGTTVEDVLKEGTSKLSTFKWNGGKDLQDHLAVYNFASQIVKGALFTPTGSAAETKAKIKEILSEKPDDSGNNDVDFDDFVRLAENGWGTIAAIDPKIQNKPYGRDRTRRPNIKELGVDGDTDPGSAE